MLGFLATPDVSSPVLTPTPPSYDVHTYQIPCKYCLSDRVSRTYRLELRVAWFAENTDYFDDFEVNMISLPRQSLHRYSYFHLAQRDDLFLWRIRRDIDELECSLRFIRGWTSCISHHRRFSVRSGVHDWVGKEQRYCICGQLRAIAGCMLVSSRILGGFGTDLILWVAVAHHSMSTEASG